MTLENIKQKLKRLSWKSILIQLVVVLILFAGIRAWQLKDAASGPAPMIDAELMTGQAVNLADYRGKPVLVHFWATWCPVCKYENEGIDAIAEDYQVITVASWSEDRSAVQVFMREHSLSMPVIVDEDGEWARLYGVSGVPTSFIIDDQGTIRFRERGFTTETGLRLRLWWLENSAKTAHNQ